MLRGLTISDMLLIDRLELTFQPGLNVLTGETGAGKSILLDSLGFVLGWRGRAELVREGAERGEVLAEFDLPKDHPAHAVLAEAGLEDDGALLLRRVNSRDGRKQAYVNDRRCAGETLRRISETLVELHGQHDDRGLLNARGHKALLDGFAGHDGRFQKLRASWRALREARALLAAHSARLVEISKDRDFLEHAVNELAELAPEIGEDAKLDGERRLMQAAERIREDINRAAQALGLDGAEGNLGDATRWLDEVEAQAEGRLAAPLAALARALDELGNAQQGVEACQAALDFNPHDLEAVEERLFAIRALARKHNTQPDALPELALNLQARLAEIESGEGDLGDLQTAVDQAAAGYDAEADQLRKARQAAADRLDKAMAAELAPLKMERAVFTTEITDTEAGPDGRDAVQFTVATNPGAPAGALNKIASGGELSRFMLALKVCLHGDVAGVTMIFDEIDRGVGGATADAVGRRLAALAQGGQVLVVTHSPQVAALGAHHFKVLKTVDGQVTRSEVVPVAGAARVDEVARMLAGDRLTDEARAAAKVLLRAGE
jgi:DNA repair protein RecN (Recombination protein N)